MYKSIAIKLILAVMVIVLYACNTASEKNEKEAAAPHHTVPAAVASQYADSVNSGLITADTLKGSPTRTAMATIGKTHLHISYHSPGVKGRIIWGGLVPYGQVWVTGAHSATNITINQPVLMNDKKIDTGTYAIFTIPGEKEWIFILNRNYTQHLADDYNQSEDVIRIKLIPAENKMTQRLTYSVVATGNAGGVIKMEWEKIKIEVPFTNSN